MGRATAVIAVIVVFVVVMAACAAVFWKPGDTGDGGDPVPPEIQAGIEVDGLPEWLTLDTEARSVVSSEVIRWHVFDELHTFYDATAFGTFTDRYAGEDVETDVLHLDPGRYTVTAGGETFSVTVYGVIEKNASWEYDTGNGTVEASVSYTIDARDLFDSTYASRLWNSAHTANGTPDFSQLTRLVVCDGLTDSIERALSDEFQRIGGDHGDPQSYLDFVASFVQCNVRYPSTVTVDGERRGWDYAVYGADEYWALPVETLYCLYGDCEDNSALLCALYREAGYDVAMGGKSGHVFAGVALDSIEKVSDERLDELGVGYLSFIGHTAVGDDYGPTYYAVETIKGQTPVGYTTWVSFGSMTMWGTTGFYAVA